MVNNLRAAFAALALVLLMNACDEQRVFETNVDIKDHAWHKDSVMQFNVPIKQADVPYNIYYNVRNALSYPYQNLYLQIEISDTTGTTIASDLNNLELFDRQTGKPYGDGLGDIFDHQIPVYRNFTFPHPGKYQIKVQHMMRTKQKENENYLPQIISVGIRVERAVAEEQKQ